MPAILQDAITEATKIGRMPYVLGGFLALLCTIVSAVACGWRKGLLDIALAAFLPIQLAFQYSVFAPQVADKTRATVRSISRFPLLFVTTILFCAVVTSMSILLLIPGVYMATRLGFAVQRVALRRPGDASGLLAAFRYSWNITEGKSVEVGLATLGFLAAYMLCNALGTSVLQVLYASLFDSKVTPDVHFVIMIIWYPIMSATLLPLTLVIAPTLLYTRVVEDSPLQPRGLPEANDSDEEYLHETRLEDLAS